MDGRGKISEPHATGTSKLDWRSLESMQIDRNKVQIRTNWQKGTRTKKPKIFRKFWKFQGKKMSKFTSLLNLWPHSSWPGTLDHLAISLVNNRYKKIGKISKNLLLILGLAYLPLPLCYGNMKKPCRKKNHFKTGLPHWISRIWPKVLKSGPVLVYVNRSYSYPKNQRTE